VILDIVSHRLSLVNIGMNNNSMNNNSKNNDNDNSDDTWVCPGCAGCFHDDGYHLSDVIYVKPRLCNCGSGELSPGVSGGCNYNSSYCG